MIRPGEFHWTDGWFFSRLDDGAVHIEHRDNRENPGPPSVSITIPPAEWESIIAHVAPGGDSRNYALAQHLHEGKPLP